MNVWFGTALFKKRDQGLRGSKLLSFYSPLSEIMDSVKIEITWRRPFGSLKKQQQKRLTSVTGALLPANREPGARRCSH